MLRSYKPNTLLLTALLLDPGMLTTRQLPNHLLAVNYRGSVTPLLFVEAQYSQKKQGFRNNGGTSTAIVDSPFRTQGALAGVPGSLFYNAPYFDSTDPEERFLYQACTFMPAAWVGFIVSSLFDPIDRLRRRLSLPRAVVGMTVAHIGLGLAVISISAVESYTLERDAALWIIFLASAAVTAGTSS